MNEKGQNGHRATIYPAKGEIAYLSLSPALTRENGKVHSSSKGRNLQRGGEYLAAEEAVNWKEKINHLVLEVDHSHST